MCIFSSCGRLSALSIARFSMLRILRGSSSRPHTAPQQYSVTSSCSGRLNSSAEANDFSTNSLPSTALRISSPRSRTSLLIVISLCGGGGPPWVRRPAGCRARCCQGGSGGGPDRFGDRQRGRIDRDWDPVLPLDDGQAGPDPAPLFVELELAAGEVGRWPLVERAQGLGHRFAIRLAGFLERGL